MHKRPPWPTATFAPPLLFLALQGCAAPMTSTEHAKYPPPGHFPPTLNRVVDGPLRFWQHNLGAYCFRTWGCRVEYGDQVIWDKPTSEHQLPAEAYPADLRKRMRGTNLGFRAFEGPLRLRWQDDQKRPHALDLDLGEIFADGLIRHHVPRDLISPTSSVGNPDIIVEIEDRTVRLYMRAHIPLKAPQDPGNPYSDFVEENILVLERTL